MKTLQPRFGTLDVRVAKPAPKRADAELLTAEGRAWAHRICERAGWRCQWIEDGQRCQASRARGDSVVADHIHERADGGAPYADANGQCLCTRHNTLKGLAARTARAKG